MSRLIQLIIKIPESDYNAICENKEDAIIAHDTCRRIANNGNPLFGVLDEMRKEIAEYCSSVLMDPVDEDEILSIIDVLEGEI